MTKIKIGFSPCPNDTFIFDALVHNKIDTMGLEFDYVLEDVQTLNEWALEEKLPVSKVSYGVLSKILDNYKVLNSGSALGKGVGPLLISNFVSGEAPVLSKPVAIPGENTTAHMLFNFAYPEMENKIFLRFDEIEDYVLSGKGLGVIIHENRFTYEARGLHKVADLGEVWERQTGIPIPLGGIVVSRDLDVATQIKIDHLIKQSLEYAYKNYQHQLPDFIRSNAQEMSSDVTQKHISLYVNDYSLSLGKDGRNAILTLLQAGGESILPEENEIFVNSIA